MWRPGSCPQSLRRHRGGLRLLGVSEGGVPGVESMPTYLAPASSRDLAAISLKRLLKEFSFTQQGQRLLLKPN